MNIIAYQPEFRPALPTVYGPKDYREFRETLIEMDSMLTKTGIEHRIISEKVAELGDSVSWTREQNISEMPGRITVQPLTCHNGVFVSGTCHTRIKQPPVSVVHLHRGNGRD